jgi:hypothetical protein
MFIPMKSLTATLCLTLAVLLGRCGVSWSADFEMSESSGYRKGLIAYAKGDYEPFI